MAPKDPTQLEDSNSHLTCCNKSVKQFGEIKNELKNIRQAVSFTAVLLSKLAGVTPEEIKALIKSSAFHDFTSSPVVDFLSIINIVSSDALVTDPCEHKSSPSEEYIDTDDVFSNLEVTFTNENKTNSVDGKTDNAESGDVSGKTSEVAALNRTSETLANETLVETEDIKSPYRVENEALTNAYLHAFTPLLQDCSLSIITSDRPPLPALGNSVKTDSASVSEDPKAVRSNTKEAVPINLCSGRPSQSELSVSTTSVTTSVDSVSSGFVTQPLSVLPDGDFPSSSAIPHSTDRDLDNREIVEIKQEQVTEYEDDNVSTAPIESRFTDFVDNVKMETEAVYISDKTMPMCLLMKSEEEFCTAEQNVASTSYATTGFAQEISSKISGINLDDGVSMCRTSSNTCIPVSQDSSLQVSSSLLGSALVLKLKQKIQEKIQAAVVTTTVDEPDDLVNNNICTESPEGVSSSGNIQETEANSGEVPQKFHHCRSCARVFFCTNALRAHIRDCTGRRKQYRCNSCPLAFSSRKVLLNHRLIHSAKNSRRGHTCETCRRHFILKSSLRKHRQSQVCKGTRMRCYRKLPQHFCVECGEGFLNSSNLALHQKLHKVDKSRRSDSAKYTGSQQAGTSGTRTARRYQCTYCYEAFIDRRSVTLHEKLHTDKEFAAFDEHRRQIQRKYQLMLMMQKQHKESNKKKFHCSICGRCYSRELLLHMHTRLHHAIS
ncbi:uncharacterized protein [Periplaneta americana]|uniref:uncharacterized protein isoform X2 n=1 Tax=Periplaneta americana TaxID=6978 RepID=UPI0037E82D59